MYIRFNKAFVRIYIVPINDQELWLGLLLMVQIFDSYSKNPVQRG